MDNYHMMSSSSRHPVYHDHADKNLTWILAQQHKRNIIAQPSSSLSSISTTTKYGQHGGGTMPPVVETFPRKLHDLLESVEGTSAAAIVSWQSHGRAFKITNQNQFEQEILPLYFPTQRKYSSFRRQLNFYGFYRLTNLGPDHAAYYHEYFLRGKPMLCTLIVRHRIAMNHVRRTLDPTSEPNFRYMPPLLPSPKRSNNNKCASSSTVSRSKWKKPQRHFHPTDAAVVVSQPPPSSYHHHSPPHVVTLTAKSTTRMDTRCESATTHATANMASIHQAPQAVPSSNASVVQMMAGGMKIVLPSTTAASHIDEPHVCVVVSPTTNGSACDTAQPSSARPSPTILPHYSCGEAAAAQWQQQQQQLQHHASSSTTSSSIWTTVLPPIMNRQHPWINNNNVLSSGIPATVSTGTLTLDIDNDKDSCDDPDDEVEVAVVTKASSDHEPPVSDNSDGITTKTLESSNIIHHIRLQWIQTAHNANHLLGGDVGGDVDDACTMTTYLPPGQDDEFADVDWDLLWPSDNNHNNSNLAS